MITSKFSRALARAQEVAAYNRRTQKLKVTGDGHRDKLVAAKLQAQSNAR